LSSARTSVERGEIQIQVQIRDTEYPGMKTAGVNWTLEESASEAKKENKFFLRRRV